MQLNFFNNIIMAVFKLMLFYLTKYLHEPLGMKIMPMALSQRGINEENVEFLGIRKCNIFPRKTRG